MTITKDTIAYCIVGLIIGTALWANAYEKHYQNHIVYPTQDDLREREIGSVLGQLTSLREDELKQLRTELRTLSDKSDLLMSREDKTEERVDNLRIFFEKYSPEVFEKIVRDIKINVERIDNRTHLPVLTEELRTALGDKYLLKYEAENYKRRIEYLEQENNKLAKQVEVVNKQLNITPPVAEQNVNPFRGNVP